MKRLSAAIVVLCVLASVAAADGKTINFQTGPGSNGRCWNVRMEGGRAYHIVARVRPASWDPNGGVAACVPIRLIVFAPNGAQIHDTGGRGGTASYYFRPHVSGSYQIQVCIGAPLGALGQLRISEG